MISRGHPSLAPSYGVASEIPLWLGMTDGVDQGNEQDKLLFPPAFAGLRRGAPTLPHRGSEGGRVIFSTKNSPSRPAPRSSSEVGRERDGVRGTNLIPFSKRQSQKHKRNHHGKNYGHHVPVGDGG